MIITTSLSGYPSKAGSRFSELKAGRLIRDWLIGDSLWRLDAAIHGLSILSNLRRVATLGIHQYSDKKVKHPKNFYVLGIEKQKDV